MQGSLNFMILLTDTQHQARLRDQPFLGSLGHLEDLQTLPEVGPRITDEGGTVLDRLEIVGVDVQARSCNLFDTGLRPLEVTREGFDQDVWSPAGPGSESVRVTNGCDKGMEIKAYFCFTFRMVSAK